MHTYRVYDPRLLEASAAPQGTSVRPRVPCGFKISPEIQWHGKVPLYTVTWIRFPRSIFSLILFAISPPFPSRQVNIA